MKIGIVTPGGFDRTGQDRVIPVFLSLVERLARRHEVHVFTLQQYPWPDEFPLAGATIHNVGFSRGPDDRPRRPQLPRQVSAAIRRVRREHRRGRFDLLHGLWASTSGLTAVLAARSFRVPSVVTLAGGELARVPDIGYGGQLTLRGRMIAGWTLRFASAVSAASEFALAPLRRVRPDARLIPLGVDTNLFRPLAEAASGPPWRLLHVASLNRVKDQPMLLRAFREIHLQEPAVHLEIIGMDTLDGAIQRLACELGLEDCVTFRGFQRSAVVAQSLAGSHLLIHSSRHETGPIVMLEAAACGIPTVGTAVGHIADLSPHAAVAIPIGSAPALADAALGLLRDAPRRRGIGARARSWALAHDADWTAARFQELYEELVR